MSRWWVCCWQPLPSALRRRVVAACWSGGGLWRAAWGAAWRRSPRGRRPGCACCTAAWWPGATPRHPWCWMCRRCTVGLSMRRPPRSSWWSTVNGGARWSTTGWPTWPASWTSSPSPAPTPLTLRLSRAGSSASTAALSKGRGGTTTSGTSTRTPVGAPRCRTRCATTLPSGPSPCRARSPPRRSHWPAGPSTPAHCWPPSRCASLGRCRPASGSSPGRAPLPAPRQPTSTTAPIWTPSSAPPSPSETSTVGCSAGSGGSGEVSRLADPDAGKLLPVVTTMADDGAPFRSFRLKLNRPGFGGRVMTRKDHCHGT